MDEPNDTEIRVQRRSGGELPSVDRRYDEETTLPPPEARVREEDLEPHEGLRYIARLFKVLSILLVLLLIGEIVIGLVQQGGLAIPTLLVEATRLIVFASFLWAAGDIVLMLVESNHDQRASRILLGRVNGKLQRLLELEGDHIEARAANPSLSRRARRGESPPQTTD
jgi:hypothetical protein